MLAALGFVLVTGGAGVAAYGLWMAGYWLRYSRRTVFPAEAYLLAGVHLALTGVASLVAALGWWLRLP